MIGTDPREPSSFPLLRGRWRDAGVVGLRFRAGVSAEPIFRAVPVVRLGPPRREGSAFVQRSSEPWPDCGLRWVGNGGTLREAPTPCGHHGDPL